MKKIIVLMFLLVPPASAGIYKWTDSNGQVHFGDRPVNNESATEINIRSNKATGVTNSSGNNKEREYLLKKIEEKKQADKKKRKEQVATDKKNRQLCNRYQARYQSHIQSGRTFMMGPDGERSYLSDKQRAAVKQQLAKGVEKYCR